MLLYGNRAELETTSVFKAVVTCAGDGNPDEIAVPDEYAVPVGTEVEFLR